MQQLQTEVTCQGCRPYGGTVCPSGVMPVQPSESWLDGSVCDASQDVWDEGLMVTLEQIGPTCLNHASSSNYECRFQVLMVMRHLCAVHFIPWFLTFRLFFGPFILVIIFTFCSTALSCFNFRHLGLQN